MTHYAKKTLYAVMGILCAVCLFSFKQSSQNKPSEKEVLILLGPPGSGKGSQAALIHDKTHLAHISTGDLLRENVRQHTELGDKAKGYMDKGELVPDDIILDMLFKRVSQPDCQMGYILDGFPRTVPQAETLKARLGKEHKVVVINLDVPDAIIIDRLAKRQLQEHRADDGKEVVLNRLAVYRKQTAPLIDFYTKQGLLNTMNGDQLKDILFEKIQTILTQNKKSSP